MTERKLRVYQAGGVAHLLRQPYGGLLMDPGTGKTLTVLSAFNELKRRKLVDSLLVVAPLRVAYEVWPAEIKKWGFDFDCTVLHGSNKDKLLWAAMDEATPVWVINYDGLPWLFASLSDKFWSSARWWIVFDESTKIKKTNTARFKNLRHRLPLFARRTILTGTPRPNKSEDLFGQVFACDLGSRLGRFITQYRRKYFFPSGYGGYGWTLQPGADKLIYKALDGLFYRVSDKVLRLKPLVRVPVYVTLPDKARKIYEKLEDNFIVSVAKKKIIAINEAVLGMKLRQCANGRIYDDNKRVVLIHDAKLDALEDLVDELSGNPLLVGFEFSCDGEAISKRFKCPVIEGGTGMKFTKSTLVAFNKGDLPVLAVQAAAGQFGLNLQEVCHHVAMYGQVWDLETHLQFYRRVQRSGQKNTVFLHDFITRDTVDEAVRSAVLTSKNSKMNLQEQLLNAIAKRSKL